MSHKVTSIPKFEKELKRLAKKYSSLKKEYLQLVQSLKEQPGLGIALGNNCFKLQLAIAFKGKGKSGGARVITCVHLVHTSVYLLTIFDKSSIVNRLSWKQQINFSIT